MQPYPKIPPARGSLVRAVLAIGFIVGLSLVSIRLLQPPSSVRADALASEFSAERAMKHLAVISERPHPSGSDDHARVRDYLAAELKTLGLTVQIQTSTSVKPVDERWPSSPITASTVQNVVGRLSGTANSGALMLGAHYDSVTTGPGASDDGSGVVTILETLRAIKSGPPLRNDLIIVISDSEEVGLLGAQAFVDEHPWAKDVKVALNFEARGNRGPVFMFETSDQNGWLIDQFAASAPAPVSNSLMYALYKRLPNDTDLTVYKRAGIAGLNFAFADGLSHYHTQLDSAAEIDPASLQHDGSYALALARQLGNADISTTRAPDSVYFNTLGMRIIHYRQSLVLPISGIVRALALAVIVLGIGRKKLTARGVVIGMAWVFLSLVLGSAIIWVTYHFVRPVYFRKGSAAWADPYNGTMMKLALTLLASAVVLACTAVFRRIASIAELHAGAVFAWSIVLAAVSVLLPGASYLFTWPLAFAVLGLAFTVIRGKGHLEQDLGWGKFIIDALLYAPAIILLAPVIYMLFIMLSLSVPLVQAVLTIFGLCLIVPLLGDLCLSTGRGLGLTVLVVIGSVGFGVIAVRGNTLDDTHRKINDVFYAADADTSRAFWMSFNAAPDDWTWQFFGPNTVKTQPDLFLPWIKLNALQAEAPASMFAPPVVEVINDVPFGGVRTVTLHVTAQPGAGGTLLMLDSGVNLLSATLAGHEMPNPDSVAGRQGQSNPFRLLFISPPTGGFDIQMRLPSNQTLKLTAEDIHFELPTFASFTISPRPSYMMPAPILAASDSSLIRKSYAFAPVGAVEAK
ncbi:MAG: hypothetical protein QOH96_1592 [Blastocatellia bacterium]|nr:hypothetical protein [Blastocatellia bacterium]